MKRKTPFEIIVEAFGGDERTLLLWPFRGRWRPRSTPRRAAMKRVSKETPPGLSPPDCLRFWGFQMNAATRVLFYLAENYERLIVN